MKKLLLTMMVLLASIGANAQKFALVDMEYILKNVPAYERANEQLNQVSKKWEGEVEVLLNEAETLYKKYQSESVFLSDTQKTKAEEAIMAKEKEASELKKKYFGSESLLAPIQDEIYNAVKDICDQKGYQLVLDRASGGSIIYASPKIDISEEVLQKLGYAH